MVEDKLLNNDENATNSPNDTHIIKNEPDKTSEIQKTLKGDTEVKLTEPINSCDNDNDTALIDDESSTEESSSEESSTEESSTEESSSDEPSSDEPSSEENSDSETIDHENEINMSRDHFKDKLGDIIRWFYTDAPSNFKGRVILGIKKWFDDTEYSSAEPSSKQKRAIINIHKGWVVGMEISERSRQDSQANRLKEELLSQLRNFSISEEHEQLLGCSSEEFYKYFRYLYLSRWAIRCRRRRGAAVEVCEVKDLHRDHIVPWAYFVKDGQISTEDQRKACHYTNLQPLCRGLNMFKGADLSALKYREWIEGKGWYNKYEGLPGWWPGLLITSCKLSTVTLFPRSRETNNMSITQNGVASNNTINSLILESRESSSFASCSWRGRPEIGVAADDEEEDEINMLHREYMKNVKSVLEAVMEKNNELKKENSRLEEEVTRLKKENSCFEEEVTRLKKNYTMYEKVTRFESIFKEEIRSFLDYIYEENGL